jgi:hypothetical protein
MSRINSPLTGALMTEPDRAIPNDE